MWIWREFLCGSGRVSLLQTLAIKLLFTSIIRWSDLSFISTESQVNRSEDYRLYQTVIDSPEFWVSLRPMTLKEVPPTWFLYLKHSEASRVQEPRSLVLVLPRPRSMKVLIPAEFWSLMSYLNIVELTTWFEVLTSKLLPNSNSLLFFCCFPGESSDWSSGVPPGSGLGTPKITD